MIDGLRITYTTLVSLLRRGGGARLVWARKGRQMYAEGEARGIHLFARVRRL